MAKWVMLAALGVAAAIMLGAAFAGLWTRLEQRSATEPPDAHAEALQAEISEMEAHVLELQHTVSELSQQEAETLAAQQQRLEADRAAREQQALAQLEAQMQAQLEEQAAMERERLRAAVVTTTTLHPKVQAEGEALVAAVVERYEDSWPWLRAAWDAAEVLFFDPRLPEPCNSSLACVLEGREVWFTLDALRLEPDIWNSASHEDVVLHELGHVWDNLQGGGDWPLVQAQFYEHYAGCRSSARSNEELRVELLVDALVIATRSINTNAYPYSQGGYGYYESGGFRGCLVDGSTPPQHLLGAISAALFNCESAQANEAKQRLNEMVEYPEGRWAAIGSSLLPRDIQALWACHGILCETGDFGGGTCQAPERP